ncbi:MAG TPA: T9SS type A sorting domain-containing protein, partial [Candidatus Marinimicrobia bacterium]|nr:T9SS type A sorting domain-containing protein [Candidatus Neomarinimicrobiota bacterium]
VTTLFTEPNDAYASVNANPNLVLARGYTSPYLVTFERKSTSGSLQPGINWLVGHTEDCGQRYLGPFGLPEEQGIITGTNANTTNVQLSIWPNTNMLDINLVQQAGATGAIYSHWISLYENLGNWNYYQFDDGMISYPSANKSPSITSLPNCLYSACWIEVQNMAFYYLGNPSVRYYYGVYGSSCSINRGGGTSSSGFAVWSQQPSSGTKLNKSIRFDGGYPVSSSIQPLSTTGKYVQVGNGATSNHSYMYVSSFYPNSLPYYFSTSQTLGPLSKSSPKIVEGRGFIIKKGDAYFKYNLEGLNVDGQNIAFVDASDEVDYSKIDNLNDVLLTEPFQLKEDSKVIFMEESGFADSIVASKAFGKEGYIHYKVELIDETTGNIVGTIKNVNFNASNVHITQKPTYSLNTKGLDSKIVRAKITLETNLVGENSGKPTTTAQDLSHIPPAIREKRLNIKNPNIILTKSYSEENVSLAKAIFEQLELEKPDIPISYSLEQNYPNPFNPATTIHYELPKAGNVTINVYNLLGEEVATLVKGEKQEGRYSVTFDGSLLSSGTYLVRMHSGNYSKTIKILLIK